MISANMNSVALLRRLILHSHTYMLEMWAIRYISNALFPSQKLFKNLSIKLNERDD